MAPSPMKRRISSPGRAAKKARPNLIPVVVNAIAGSEAVAGDVRTLLKQTLPIVLKANKEDRHAYEVAVVNQASEALQTVKGERAKAHQDATAKQNELISPAEEQKRKAGKAAAEEKLAAAKTNVDTCKGNLKACEQAEEEAKAALSAANKETTAALTKVTRDEDHKVSEAKHEEKQAGKVLAGHEAKKATLDAALETDFVALRDCTGAAKGAAQGIIRLGHEYKLDKTLLDVFSTAAPKSADKRSEFETMSFTNLQKLLTEVQGTLASNVAGAAPIKAQKAQAVADAEAAKTAAVAAAEAAKTAAVDAAKATHDGAKAATKAAEEAVAAAINARAEASKELTKAEKHLRDIWEDMRHACDAQDEAAADVKQLADEVMAAFEQLKEKAPEPEPVEEPEPMDLSAPAAEPSPPAAEASPPAAEASPPAEDAA